MRLKSIHPESRILTEVVSLNHEKGEILAKAHIYLGGDLEGKAAASDYAFGIAATYPVSMRKFYVEDTVTSAIGRAISLVIPTDKKPTREDMAKVQAHDATQSLIQETKAKMATTGKEYVPIAKEDDPWTIREAAPATTVDEAVGIVKDIIGGQTQRDIPNCTKCHDHKPMSWATGVSGKTKKPWGKFGCFVCKDVIWYEIAADGSWQPQKNKW
jgi:hypothetical protein